MAPRRGAARQRLLAVLVVGAVATGARVPAAVAAEPGVHIDPGSPAGKEYALPVDQARRDAGGSATRGGSGSNGGQGGLFGAGIGPPGGGGGGTAGGHGASGSHGSANAATQRASGGSSGSGTAAGIRVSSTSAESSDGALIGIVAGVLLLGAVCGLGARRLRTEGT
jgi:hypothetical protein